jgi:hypothetical protein
MSDGLKLNLGSFDRRFEGYISVDIVPPCDQIVDLAGPWPWGTSSVRAVKAYDVLEHIPDCSHVNLNYACAECAPLREMIALAIAPPPENLKIWRPPIRDRYGKRHVMNELWRVLEPGARALIQVPHASDGNGGHCDPTHRTYWTESDFEYYVVGIFERERFRGSDYYGVKADFKVTNLDPYGHIRKTRHPRKLGGFVVEMLVELEAVK